MLVGRNFSVEVILLYMMRIIEEDKGYIFNLDYLVDKSKQNSLAN